MALKDTVSLIRTSPERWGFRFAMVAAVVFMVMKSGMPLTGYEAMAAGLALGAAALIFEYVGAKNMAVSWFERSPGALFGWGLLWLGAFVFSANNWLGAASDTEAGKAMVQKAAFVSYDDGRKDLEAARKRVKADEDTLEKLKAMTWQPLPKVNGKDIASAEAAKVIMESTREGSTRHTQASIAYADLKQREKWSADIKAAEKQLAEGRDQLRAAQAKASATKVASSEDRSDLRFYTKYASMTPEAAGDFQSFIRIGAVSLFISLFAWLHIRDDYKGKPRRPWISFNVLGLIARIRKAWDGTDHTQIIDRTVTRYRDPVTGVLRTGAAA